MALKCEIHSQKSFWFKKSFLKMSQFKKIPKKVLNLKPKPLNIYKIKRVPKSRFIYLFFLISDVKTQIPLVKLFFSYARRDEVFFVVKNSLKV